MKVWLDAPTQNGFYWIRFKKDVRQIDVARIDFDEENPGNEYATRAQVLGSEITTCLADLNDHYWLLITTEAPEFDQS